MPYKDPVKRKEANAKNYEKYKEKYKEKNKIYRDKKKEYFDENKEKKTEYDEKHKEYESNRRKDLKQYAIDLISNGEIIDRDKWDRWCNDIKRRAQKHPYTDDFTNDIIFEMMVRGCFYCGDIATTIDRIDSTINHVIYNCVGCCMGCNNSKGTADISTFVRKAYYRTRGVYIDDDTDIWFVHKTKPSIYDYKKRAKKKGVLFDLVKEDFDYLINGDCEYCHRTPTTWFGIDRVIPSLGYVVGNVVSCCCDCNVDKHDEDVGTMSARNERISARVDIGELVIDDRPRMILHYGFQTSSKKAPAGYIVGGGYGG